MCLEGGSITSDVSRRGFCLYGGRRSVSNTRDFTKTTTEDSVKIPGYDCHNAKSILVRIDDNLKFSPHVNSICSKAGGQLNSLFRFNRYLSPYTKKLSVNSYILSNFGYCPLVWHFCSAKSKNKIEQIQKRAFKFLSLNNDTPINADCTMETKRLRSLGIEIFKALNNINAG